MNTELKALVQLALDMYLAGKSAVDKQDFVTVVLPKIYKVAMDAPGVVGNWSQLQAEIAALTGTAQEADLVAFITTTVSGVTSDAHALSILNASLKLVGDLVADVMALSAAIKA